MNKQISNPNLRILHAYGTLWRQMPATLRNEACINAGWINVTAMTDDALAVKLLTATGFETLVKRRAGVTTLYRRPESLKAFRRVTGSLIRAPRYVL